MLSSSSLDYCTVNSINLSLPAGRVLVLQAVVAWRSCQGEVGEAAQCAISGVAVVQTWQEGRGERDEERLKTNTLKHLLITKIQTTQRTLTLLKTAMWVMNCKMGNQMPMP